MPSDLMDSCSYPGRELTQYTGHHGARQTVSYGARSPSTMRASIAYLHGRLQDQKSGTCQGKSGERSTGAGTDDRYDTQVAVKIIREGGLSPTHIAKVQRVSQESPIYCFPSALELITRTNRMPCESQSCGTASDMKMSSRCTASPQTLPSLPSYQEWFPRGARMEMCSSLCRSTQIL
jgi:hypothetical protein